MADRAVAKARARALARQRALAALADLHPDEFADLYEAERRARGLPPVQPTPRRERRRATVAA